MADLATTKTFTDGVAVAASDFNAIIPQTSLQATAITAQSGVTPVGGDTMLLARAGALKSATLSSLATFIGTAYSIGNIAATGGVTITTAALASPVPGPVAGTIQSMTVTGSVAGKRAAITQTLILAPVSGCTSFRYVCYRSDGASCGDFTFPIGSISTPNAVNFTTLYFDNNTLAGNITYYFVAQATIQNCVVTNHIAEIRLIN